MARPRNHLSIVQALLGLLFLAWLPAIESAAFEPQFLIQFEETLLSDAGEPDRETCPDKWGGGGGPDASTPLALTCRSIPGLRGKGIRSALQEPVPFNLLGTQRATGPPGLRI